MWIGIKEADSLFMKYFVEFYGVKKKLYQQIRRSHGEVYI